MTKSTIIIPRIHLNAAIVEETCAHDLNRGPMHLAGTGLPGQAGNCCIAAHKERWFRGLKKLARGDTVTIQSGDRHYTYSITGRQIVCADNTSTLDRTRTPTLTLITCTGPSYFGRGKGRLIVTGVLKTTKQQT
jgi:sortase A